MWMFANINPIFNNGYLSTILPTPECILSIAQTKHGWVRRFFMRSYARHAWQAVEQMELWNWYGEINCVALRFFFLFGIRQSEKKN